ncbi:MAG: DUF4383 domain-containing protein [Candidatus Nitronauta litoralis]|uniref:DUF4383 domain-containing protein n=1 Tax=Candidatus Nitronauta litoralis TaxID=2705533 RepID=A0A7T0FZE1_9BACT|nr:MAG: DUF4383 domain-containing protein [Candidatus Nitronauta litoralis]
MNTFATKLACFFSAAFLLAAVVGFFPNPVVGANGVFITNAAHNLVHLATSLGFAAVAILGNTASLAFLKGFGATYLLVGAVGFFVTGMGSEGMLLGFIHINAMDNFLHLALGTTILTSGILSGVVLKTQEA